MAPSACASQPWMATDDPAEIGPVDAIIRDMTFEDGFEAQGAGIRAGDGAQAVFEGCVVRGNTSQRGGGLSIDGGTVVVRGNRIESNVGIGDHGGGIYAAGPARGVASSAVQRTEADDVSLVIVQQHRNSEKANPQAAEIDPHQCVRCLTCLRLCPYGAITLNTKPRVMPTACEGCGLCRAECPRQAIFLAPLEQANLIEQAGLGLEQDTAAPGKPRMVAFCCGPCLMNSPPIIWM